MNAPPLRCNDRSREGDERVAPGKHNWMVEDYVVRAASTLLGRAERDTTTLLARD